LTRCFPQSGYSVKFSWSSLGRFSQASQISSFFFLKYQIPLVFINF